MKATRMGFYFNIIGINFYFEGDFYLTPAGGCDHVDITGGSFLMKPALKLVLPGVINCPSTDSGPGGPRATARSLVRGVLPGTIYTVVA